MFIIRRDGNIVKHVVFEGKSSDLYKESKVVPLVLETEYDAKQVNFALNGVIEEISEEELKKVS